MTEINTVHEHRFDEFSEAFDATPYGYVPMRCACGKRRNVLADQVLTAQQMDLLTPRLQEL